MARIHMSLVSILTMTTLLSASLVQSSARHNATTRSASWVEVEVSESSSLDMDVTESEGSETFTKTVTTTVTKTVTKPVEAEFAPSDLEDQDNTTKVETHAPATHAPHGHNASHAPWTYAPYYPDSHAPSSYADVSESDREESVDPLDTTQAPNSTLATNAPATDAPVQRTRTKSMVIPAPNSTQAPSTTQAPNSTTQAPSTTQAESKAPSTAQPTTAEPSTVKPTTQAPNTTVALTTTTTVAPSTAQPTTAAPNTTVDPTTTGAPTTTAVPSTPAPTTTTVDPVALCSAKAVLPPGPRNVQWTQGCFDLGCKMQQLRNVSTLAQCKAQCACGSQQGGQCKKGGHAQGVTWNTCGHNWCSGGNCCSRCQETCEAGCEGFFGTHVGVSSVEVSVQSVGRNAFVAKLAPPAHSNSAAPAAKFVKVRVVPASPVIDVTITTSDPSCTVTGNVMTCRKPDSRRRSITSGGDTDMRVELSAPANYTGPMTFGVTIAAGESEATAETADISAAQVQELVAATPAPSSANGEDKQGCVWNDARTWSAGCWCVFIFCVVLPCVLVLAVVVYKVALCHQAKKEAEKLDGTFTKIQVKVTEGGEEYAMKTIPGESDSSCCTEADTKQADNDNTTSSFAVEMECQTAPGYVETTSPTSV